MFSGKESMVEEPQPTAPKSTAQIVDKGAEASIKALRRRVAELEKALAMVSNAGEKAISNATELARKEFGNGRPPHEMMRERMEQMKRDNPERFAQMTNRFARMHQRMVKRRQETKEFLASVDTSRMSSSAKKVHSELQELLAKKEDLEGQLHQEDLTEQNRRALMEEMHSIDMEVSKLNSKERSNLLEETAKTLGFEGDDVKAISSTIEQVIDSTESRGMHGGPQGTPPPGPPPM